MQAKAEPASPGVMSVPYWKAPWDVCPVGEEIALRQEPSLSPPPVEFSGRFTAEAQANALDVNHAITGCSILGSLAASGLAILVFMRRRRKRRQRRGESLQGARSGRIATPPEQQPEQVQSSQGHGGGH